MSDGSNVNDTTQSAAEQKKQQQRQETELKKQLKNKAKSETKKAVKKARKKASQAMYKSVIASGGMIVFSVIIVVLMMVGIVVFILTMPGMVRDNIFDNVSGFFERVDDFFHGGKEHIITSEEILGGTVDALKNLEDMGLDPVGLGFVHDVLRDEDGKISGFNVDAESYVNGLRSGSDSFIVDEIPTSCPLLQYFLANEKTYLPSEYYLKTSQVFSIADTFWGDSTDYSNRELMNGYKYTKRDDGMLRWNEITEEGFSLDGITKININRADRTMDYTNTVFSNGALVDLSYTVDLESWVGRYGKPLEFLVALHLGTMTSDISQEFATNKDLQTKVDMEFQEGNYKLDFKIEVKNDDGSRKDLGITAGVLDLGEDLALYNLIKELNCIDKMYDEDEHKYKIIYDTSKTEGSKDRMKEAVTISSLRTFCKRYLLVSNFRPGAEELAETNEYGLDVLDNGIQEFLYGNDPIYFKYDINLSDETYPQTMAYLGTYNEGEGQGTGFLSNEGTFSFMFNDYIFDINNNSPTENKNGNATTDGILFSYEGDWYKVGTEPNRDGGTMMIDVSSDADVQNSRSTTQVYGLNHFIEDDEMNMDLSILNANPRLRDAITCFMLEVDSYLQERSPDMELNDMISSGNSVNVKFEQTLFGYESYPFAESRVTIDFDPYYPSYEMNFTDYNYLISHKGSSVISNGDDGYSYIESTCPGYFTRKWLTALTTDGWITQDEIREIRDELAFYADIINNREENLKVILNGIWRDAVAPEDCPLTPDAIYEIYDLLYEYTQGVQELKMAWPRITKVTNHWFKDIDFSDAYTDTNKTIQVPAFEDETIATTALLTNEHHKTQTSQPYVIKGDVVMLDGDVIGNTADKYGEDSEFGKGYEASKKILTGGYYYVYDGTEATSKGILYNRLLENVLPGNTVDVSVTDAGSIMFIKQGGTVAVTSQNPNIPQSSTMTKSGCQVTYYGDTDWVTTVKTGSNGESGSTTEVIGKIHHYQVTIPESLKYISAAEDMQKAKESAEKINEVLTALGVNQLRKPVSFDNTTSGGDVATLTAFSILEGMKSDTAQTVYRDLKEFLIELGYYTKAEFEYLSNNVLDWFIPDYMPSNPEHWAQNQDEDILLYGAILYPSSESASGEGNTTEESNTENEQTTGDENNAGGEQATEEQENEEETSDENNTNTNSTMKGFEPDLDVIAPGNARILENGGSYITLEFDGISEPKIAMLDKYVMTIKGISVQIAESDGDKVKAGTVIGKTTTERIQVILKNANGAILNNVEDYMHPNSYGSDMPYQGCLSQQFYYYLGVELEGMKYTTDEYFTAGNGNVEALHDNAQSYVTVGPGVLMDDGSFAEYLQRGGDYTNNRDANSIWRKSIILDMYVENMDAVYAARIEELLDGYEISQTQMEALVLSCYQRGTGNLALLQIISKIKNGASADELKSLWVVPYGGPGGHDRFPGVLHRRYAEWYLYKYGVYISPYSNSSSGATDVEFDFGSETPWDDFLNGNL